MMARPFGRSATGGADAPSAAIIMAEFSINRFKWMELALVPETDL